jgi:hypothetical protein
VARTSTSRAWQNPSASQNQRAPWSAAFACSPWKATTRCRGNRGEQTSGKCRIPAAVEVLHRCQMPDGSPSQAYEGSPAACGAFCCGAWEGGKRMELDGHRPPSDEIFSLPTGTGTAAAGNGMRVFPHPRGVGLQEIPPSDERYRVMRAAQPVSHESQIRGESRADQRSGCGTSATMIS